MANSRERSWPPAPAPLTVPVTDNHAHLDMIDWVLSEGVVAPTVRQYLDDAAAVGVHRVLQIGCDLPSARSTVSMIDEYPLLGGIAIHPNEAPLHAGAVSVGPDSLEPQLKEHHVVGLDDAISEIANLARAHDRIRVIGETGLDKFRTGEAGSRAQVDSFRAHIALAKELDLALQIHDRDAHGEVLEILAKDGAPERTVFHCYSGDAEMAKFCARQGWYLSFAGPVTFKANDELRRALREVPHNQVLVETDAPFLTPMPYRGRPNASYLVPLTLRVMAQVKEISEEELAGIIDQTSEQVYGAWPR